MDRSPPRRRAGGRWSFGVDPHLGTLVGRVGFWGSASRDPPDAPSSVSAPPASPCTCPGDWPGTPGGSRSPGRVGQGGAEDRAWAPGWGSRPRQVRAVDDHRVAGGLDEAHGEQVRLRLAQLAAALVLVWWSRGTASVCEKSAHSGVAPGRSARRPAPARPWDRGLLACAGRGLAGRGRRPGRADPAEEAQRRPSREARPARAGARPWSRPRRPSWPRAALPTPRRPQISSSSPS